MTKAAIALLALLGLTGCKTNDQLAMDDDSKCLTYGVQKGSPPYVECRMLLEKQRNDRNMVLMSAPGTAVFVNSR